MPRNNHRAPTPVPVPISIAARADVAAANMDNVAPVLGEIGVRPTSAASRRATITTSSSGRKASPKSRPDRGAFVSAVVAISDPPSALTLDRG